MPEHFSVVPGEGLGPVRFGETRSTYRDTLGKHRRSRRTPTDTEADQYPDLGVILYFGEDERVDFIEATEPLEVDFRGVALLAGRSQTLYET